MKKMIFTLLLFTAFLYAKEDGDGLSISTDVYGNNVVYGRVFYNYVEDTSSGRVYIYRKNEEGLELVQELPQGEEDEVDYFGGQVKLSDGKLFIGNSLNGGLTSNDKKIDIYQMTDEGWKYVRSIKPPEGYSKTTFDIIDSSDTRLVVGANINDESVIQIYSADDDYSSFKTIKDPGREGCSRFFFPKSASIYEDNIVVSATCFIDDLTVGNPSLHFYIFDAEKKEWVKDSVIVVEEVGQTQIFGNSLSLSGDYLLVSAREAGENKNGAALIYHKNERGWYVVKTLKPDENENTTYFGWNVSLDGEWAVVTDRTEDKHYPFGTTYAFHRRYNPEDPETAYPENWGLYEKYENNENDPEELKGAVMSIDSGNLSMGAAPAIDGKKITPYFEELKLPVFTAVNDDDQEVDDEDTDVNDVEEAPDAVVDETAELQDEDTSEQVSGMKTNSSACTLIMVE